MKLKRLTIDNIASIEHAVIDFDAAPLADEHLFLITGETGSGKSTIIDCLCLALYGNTPRLNGVKKAEYESIGSQEIIKTSDAKQLLRRGAVSGDVTLTFDNNDGVPYIATWHIQRKHKKADNKIMSPERKLMTEDGVTPPVFLRNKTDIDAHVIELTGLDMNEFFRTVVLAQGKFAEFLNSDENEKAALLEKMTGTEVYAQVGTKIYEVCRDKENKRNLLLDAVKNIVLLSDEEKAAIGDQVNELLKQQGLAAQQRDQAKKMTDWLDEKAQNEKKLFDKQQELAQQQELSQRPEYLERQQLVIDWEDTIEPRRESRDLLQATKQITELQALKPAMQEEYDDLCAALRATIDNTRRMREQCDEIGDYLKQEEPNRGMYEAITTIKSLMKQRKQEQSNIEAFTLTLKQEQDNLPKVKEQVNDTEKAMEQQDEKVKQLQARMTELGYYEGPISGKQLIRVMNLDRLDQKHNASPDGRFDFIEGLTVYSSGGKIIFPVLEPFGSHLAKSLGNDPRLVQKYCYQELYDSTLVVAQELSEKNKFHLTGKYKGTNGSEIRLGAMNVPRGSVTVTAGGATLIENVDYTVDYTMGTVTILNTSILESGTNVDVKLENQSTFSMQRKSLFGAHLEYEFNKDLVLGGTIMHLRERPLTTKVNTGSEPLANTIWGINGSWKTEMQWLTNAIDKIPWITATAPSTFQINAEFAHLIPGHTNDVGRVGTAYIDDFENTTTNIDVHYPSYWFLASTPAVFDESKDINQTSYNKNRAHLSWFTVDPIFGYPQTNTPAHIRDDLAALSDHRTRIVYQDEIYPNRQEASNVDTKLAILNLAYYPSERGQYNVSASEIGSDGRLTSPKKRWAGIMRKLDNTDFEKANIEYIQFWLMDPALTNPDGYEGELYINLGDISEDILRDGKKAFEHGLPVSAADQGRVDSTIWGYVPKTTSTVVAFSNEEGSRAMQDVGLNGLSTAQELSWPIYRQYLTELEGKVSADVWSAWGRDRFSPRNDPAGDNFHYYRGSDYDQEEVSILNRYKHFNGTEGNSPATEQQTESYGTASTLTPDIEDINLDNTLNEYEKYYQYKVILRPDMMEVGRQHITEKKVRQVTLRNGETADVTWYQFKIPLRGDSATVQKVGSIRNWKSIRFMRMYLTGCEKETHLRFATLDLVRGDWRQYTRDLAPIGTAVNSGASIDVQTVNIEENSTRTPVNYVLPPGVSRQTDPGQAQLIAQNEQAMVLRVMNLSPYDARAMYKNTGYDMRQYKNLQMFVHAEQLTSVDPNLKDGDLTCFIRLGTDLRNNYYEYEIPLHLTPPGIYNNNSAADREIVWPKENMFDFPLKVFTAAKTARNKAKRAGNEGVSNTIPYVIYDDANDKPQNKITVLGNPTLEEVSTIMIGVRNNGQHEASGEIWVNELRLSQFNEQGGVAAMANASLAISDIAQVNVAGRLETAGYGSIESNVLDRNIDNFYQLSVSAALEAGRLFPEKAKIQMPLYVSYSNETTKPDYDPLDTDVKLSETLDTYDTKAERDSIKQMTNTVHESTSFSVSNMKVNIHSKKKDMFYDPANFSISASYNKQSEHSPELERNITTDHKGSFQYAYNFNPKPWEPLWLGRGAFQSP